MTRLLGKEREKYQAKANKHFKFVEFKKGDLVKIHPRKKICFHKVNLKSRVDDLSKA